MLQNRTDLFVANTALVVVDARQMGSSLVDGFHGLSCVVIRIGQPRESEYGRRHVRSGNALLGVDLRLRHIQLSQLGNQLAAGHVVVSRLNDLDLRGRCASRQQEREVLIPVPESA